jgi:hypothetical protein
VPTCLIQWFQDCPPPTAPRNNRMMSLIIGLLMLGAALLQRWVTPQQPYQVAHSHSWVCLCPRLRVFNCVPFSLIVGLFLSFLLDCISGFGSVRYPLSAGYESSSGLSGFAFQHCIRTRFFFTVYLCRTAIGVCSMAIFSSSTVVFRILTSCSTLVPRSIMFSIVLAFL